MKWVSRLIDKLFFNKDPRIERLSKLSQIVPGSLRKSFFGISFKGIYKKVKFSVSFWGADKQSATGVDAYPYPCLEINWFKGSPLTYEAYSRKNILICPELNSREKRYINGDIQ